MPENDLSFFRLENPQFKPDLKTLRKFRSQTQSSLEMSIKLLFLLYGATGAIFPQFQQLSADSGREKFLEFVVTQIYR